MMTTTRMYESDCRRSNDVILSSDPTWLKTELFRRMRPGKVICIDRFAQQLYVLQRKRNVIISALDSCATALGNTTTERFSIIAGAANLIQGQKRMIAEADQDYVGIMNRYGLKDSRQNGLADTLIAANRRGMKVRLIVDVDETNAKIADYVSRRLELRISKGILFYMGIIDKSQMVIGPAFTDGDDMRQAREVDLWTNSARFVRGMYALFEKLWTTSIVASRHSVSIVASPQAS